MQLLCYFILITNLSLLFPATKIVQGRCGTSSLLEHFAEPQLIFFKKNANRMQTIEQSLSPFDSTKVNVTYSLSKEKFGNCSKYYSFCTKVSILK